MDARRTQRAQTALLEVAGVFISEHGNRSSLITPTRAYLSSDSAHADIYVTVLPEESVEAALAFLNRNADDVRTLIKKRLRLRRLPHVHFSLDRGEKHRQRLDDLSHDA